MTTKLEQHRIDHIKLDLDFFGYNTSDFGVVNNQLYIKDSGINHSSVSNLLEDSHSQYALLAGRSGGQTLIGGTDAGDDLTLQSTSNGTKGSILFGTSAYDEVNNRLGIGTTTPSYRFDSYISNTDLPNGTNTFAAQFEDDNNTGYDGGLLVNSYLPRLCMNDRSTSARWFDARVNGTKLIFGAGANTNLFSRRTDNILVLDGTNNRVGIGTSSPSNKLDVIGDVGIYGSSSDNEGIALQTAYSNGNSSGRLFFIENSNNLFGFSWLYAGNPNPTIGGTSFTLDGNYLHLLRHDNSETGAIVMAISRGNGNVGIGASSPAVPLDVNADSIRIRTSQSPASNGTGTQGEIAWDSSYLYVCYNTNQWARIALTTGY